MNFKQLWRRINLWLVFFLLVVMYSVSSINILILAMSVLTHIETALYSTHVLVYFALISFVLAAFVSIYHMNSMFRSQKRIQDRQRSA